MEMYIHVCMYTHLCLSECLCAQGMHSLLQVLCLACLCRRHGSAALWWRSAPQGLFSVTTSKRTPQAVKLQNPEDQNLHKSRCDELVRNRVWHTGPELWRCPRKCTLARRRQMCFFCALELERCSGVRCVSRIRGPGLPCF